MNAWLIALFGTSLELSVVIALLLALNRALGGRVSAAFRHCMWLVVAIGLLIPFRPALPLSFDPLPLPAVLARAIRQDAPPEGTGAEISPAGTPHRDAAASPPPAASGIPVGLVLAGIWMTGAAAVLAFHLRAYVRFVSAVRRWGEDAEDSRMRPLLRAARNAMRVGDRPIAVKTCAFASSPMLIGFFRPTIILPERTISTDELECILRHELAHCRRGDIWMNLLILLSLAIHWFNPFVHLMARAVRSDCEAACDEMAVAGNDTEERRRYGEVIIGFAGTNIGGIPVLSTYFFGGGEGMRKRLASIMDTGRKSAWPAALCAALVVSLTLLSGGAFAASAGGQIGEAEARSIALAHAGVPEEGAVFVKSYLDRDHGRVVYDIEFYSGSAEYDYEIDAASGQIVGFDRDIERRMIPGPAAAAQPPVPVQTLPAAAPAMGAAGANGYIGEERAKAIALANAGLAESQVGRMRIHLDYDHGRPVYDIGFHAGERTEYDYEIDAVSGAILESDVDYDD